MGRFPGFQDLEPLSGSSIHDHYKASGVYIEAPSQNTCGVLANIHIAKRTRTGIGNQNMFLGRYVAVTVKGL